jgi:hypothetical protein
LTRVDDKQVIDATLTAPLDALESKLDYTHAQDPGDMWVARAQRAVAARPLEVPASVHAKFVVCEAKVCPTCGRPMKES